METSYDEIFGRADHVDKFAGDLMALARGELDESRQTEVEAHVATCAACRLELVHFRRAIEDERSAWERGQQAVREFITRGRPELSRQVDVVWRFLDGRNLLGTLPTGDLGTPVPEIGFIAPGASVPVPAVVMVLSSILTGIIDDGRSAQDALEEVRARAEDLFTQAGLADEDELRQLDRFVASLQEKELGA